MPTGLIDLFRHVPTGLKDLCRHVPTGLNDLLRHVPTGLNDLFRHVPTRLNDLLRQAVLTFRNSEFFYETSFDKGATETQLGWITSYYKTWDTDPVGRILSQGISGSDGCTGVPKFETYVQSTTQKQLRYGGISEICST